MLSRLFRPRGQTSSKANNNAAKKSSSDSDSRKDSDSRIDGGGRKNSGRRSGGKTSSGNSSSSNSSSSNSSGNKSSKGSARAQQRGKAARTSVKENWSLDDFKVQEQRDKSRFHDFDLPLPLMHAIADLGFEYCSPIQAQSLPYTLNGQDVIGKAQTGTGKTVAFLITIIDELLKHPAPEERYAGEARSLVIAPTRELVLQIADDAKSLTKYTDLEVHTLVGGMDYGKQQQRLNDRLVDILVATPGRLLDFCGNGDVYLDQVEIMVIDEADRMLDMGFIPQVRRIVRSTPQKSHRQTLCFSATFSQDVMNLVDQWTLEPVTVDIEPEHVATDNVTQYIYLAAGDEKYTLLYNILQQEDVESMIVFANRRDQCRRLKERLQAHGLSVGLLSGEIAQNKRVQTLDAFKSRKLKVLVATDVAGRGIHIDGISHVVNFTLPDEPEDYVHRIGRTGRAGKTGTSISFACEDDAFRLMPIQELLGEKLKCTQPPENLLLPAPEVFIKELSSPRSNRPSGGKGRPSSRSRSSNRSAPRR